MKSFEKSKLFKPLNCLVQLKNYLKNKKIKHV